MNAVVRIQDYRQNPGRKPPALHFTRAELSRLLGLYATRVIKGEWRDYAISFGPGMASFFIFRHTGTLDSPGGTDHQIPPGRVRFASGGV